ncbi:MAG: dUTPase [Clostridiales bacterium]|jgi:dimeric dUTPase (all-alpha-NTP-PPase superfamily)|nr:dUTPase [Clostridiales bacterium]
MDRLEHMLTIQKSLNDAIRDKRDLHGIAPETWIQKHTLAIISELAELLDEVNFKWWKNPKAIDTPALKEELVDILHFFLSMCLEAGLDAEEMYQIYLNKNAENFARQEGRSAKPGYAPEQ